MKFKDLFNEDWTVNWEKIVTIPQFDKLMSTKQSAVYHGEGNVYIHTSLVTQEMEKLLVRNFVKKGSPDWVMCMAAALCHDLGKAEATKWSVEDNDWRTKNHGVVGERITRNLFHDEEIVLREKVCYMVRHHMALHHVYDKPEQTNKQFIKLSHGIVPIKYMILLNVADSLGSINDMETEETLANKEMTHINVASSLRCYQTPYSYINKSQLIRDFIDYKGEIVDDKNNFCVYILVGFPGSGKSTYYGFFLDDKPVLSRDSIRCELGIGGATIDNGKKVVGTAEEEDKVSEIFNNRMISFCEEKISFVIDNTNLKYQYRKDYLLKIMKYNPKVKIIYVEAPDFINDCVERRKGEIQESVYNRMNSNFDFPQLYECDELIIVKQQADGPEKTHVFKGDFVQDLTDDIRCLGDREYISKTKILNDLKITRGTMILDGYDCYDSCIKYMDELISNYETIISFYETSDETF